MDIVICHAWIGHAVEPLNLCHESDDSPETSRGSSLTRRANILLYSWRGDSHCCKGLIGVSRAYGGSRDVASALASVEHGERDKHAPTCRSHGFDFIPFLLS